MTAAQLPLITYYGYPSLEWTDEDIAGLHAKIAEVRPSLVWADSVNGLLVPAGLSENSNDDAPRLFKRVFLNMSRHDVAPTMLVIDHSGWDKSRARGASSKIGYADVQYRVECKEPFAPPDKSGRLQLECMKDRDGRFVRKTTFDVPVTVKDSQISITVQEMDARDPTSAGPKLLDSERKVLDVLGIAAPAAMSRAEIEVASKLSRKTVTSALARLVADKLVVKFDGQVPHYALPLDKADLWDTEG